MYGAAGDYPKTENDQTAPLTAYAKSKIGVEQTLKQELRDKDIDITFLRFATACGISDRLRLDLVLNDFVASAYKYKSINIISDGTPWRPLIDVNDMSRAVAWALTKPMTSSMLSVNIGSNEWNFRVSQLAEIVAKIVPGTSILVNSNAPPDKRSYQVNFDLFKKLAPDFYPICNIEETIIQLANAIKNINLPLNNFRNSNYLRLNHLTSLLQRNLINNKLRWN
jgi:nucleoside-diphosphate-sugar epimerase